jgi:hypothetical protein
MANTWYVSNAAQTVGPNTYIVGTDGAGHGTSPGNPTLTINGAIALMSAGDTIIVNGGPTIGSPNIYPENSGSGYLALPTSFAYILTGDTNGLRPVIRPTATNGRCTSYVNNTHSQQLTWLSLDGNGGSGTLAAGHAETLLTFTQCNFQNGSGIGIACGNNSGTITADRCTFASTLTGTYAIEVGITGNSNILSKGSSFLNTGTAFGTGSGPALASLHLTIGGDGTTQGVLNQGSNNSGIYLSQTGTITNLIIDNTQITSTGGVYIPHGTVITSTLVSFNNNTINSATMNQRAFTVTGDIACSNIQIYGNTGTGNLALFLIASAQSSNIQVPPSGQTGNTYTATNDDAYLAVITTTGLQIGPGNTWTALGSAPNAGVIGNDGGYFTDASATTVSGSAQPLGNGVSTVFLGQIFTTSAVASSSHCPWFDSCYFKLAKVGSPTFTITAYLYATSGGAITGSALDTSVNTISASTISGTAAFYYFKFRGAYVMSPSTQYAVVLRVSAAGDVSDYVAVTAGTSYAGTGTAVAGTSSPTWTPISGVNLIFYACTNPLGLTGFVATGDTYIGPNTSGTAVEGLIVACTGAGTVKNNICTGCNIGFGVKENIASVVIENCLANCIGSLHTYQLKGAYQAKVINCIGVCSNSAADTMNFGSDNSQAVTVVNQLWGSGCVVENNIFFRTAASATGVTYTVYQTGANQTAGNVNLTINNNVVYGPAGSTISDLYSTWTLWQGAGFDTNSVNSDPKLSNEINPSTYLDFIPASNSPAKAIGTPTLVTADYLGTNYALPPDAGAFSIAAYYLGLTANAQFLDLYTHRPYRVGLTLPVAESYFMLNAQTAVVTGAMAVASTVAPITILANATSGNFTITLPVVSAANQGQEVRVIQTDSSGNTVSIATQSSQNFLTTSGLSSTPLTTSAQGKSWTLVASQTEWVNTAKV